MTTALDLITDALIEIGCADVGQSVPSEDADLGLRYLNRVLQRWSNMRLLIPAVTNVSVTLTGAGSYTIGPTGVVVTTRPNKVLHARASDAGGTDYPVRIISRAEWDIISVKAVNGGPPEVIWYQATNTDGTLNVYPRSTGYTLTLGCQSLLASFAGLATAVTLPEGYESALVLTLADDLTAPFQVRERQDVQRRAAAATRVLKRTNAEPLLMRVAESTDFEIERGY